MRHPDRLRCPVVTSTISPLIVFLYPRSLRSLAYAVVIRRAYPAPRVARRAANVPAHFRACHRTCCILPTVGQVQRHTLRKRSSLSLTSLVNPDGPEFFIWTVLESSRNFYDFNVVNSSLMPAETTVGVKCSWMAGGGGGAGVGEPPDVIDGEATGIAQVLTAGPFMIQPDKLAAAVGGEEISVSALPEPDSSQPVFIERPEHYWRESGPNNRVSSDVSCSAPAKPWKACMRITANFQTRRT